RGTSSLLLSCAKHFANFQTGLSQPPSTPNNLFRKGLYISSACADKSLAVFQCQQETGVSGSRPILGSANVMVQRGKIQAPGASPVVAFLPEGMSSARRGSRDWRDVGLRRCL